MQIKPDQYGTIAIGTGIGLFGIGIILTSAGTITAGIFVLVLGAVARNLFKKMETRKK